MTPDVPYRVGPVGDPSRYLVADPTPLATESGQGLVFRATTVRDGEALDVALKQLHSAGPADLGRIDERLRPLRGLSHPNLVEHIEAFVGPPLDAEGPVSEEFDLVYVVSRWVDGLTLDEAGTSADVATRLRWVTEIGRAAAFLHGIRTPGCTQGLIHRDIKPSNIVVYDGRAVLIDFGLVRPVSDEPTDTRVFSAAWMAPETFGHPDNASPRSDAWAIGQLAYWSLCGQQPSWRREPQSLRSVLTKAATGLGVEDPSGISARVARMLAEEPANRPELSPWCDAMDEMIGPGRRHRWRATMAAALVAGTALAVPLALWLSSTDRGGSLDESAGRAGDGVPAIIVEQQGTNGADTFRDPYGASEPGERVPPMASVEVSCKVHGPAIESANPDGYWYRLASEPWNDELYAVANTFWNGDIPNRRPYVHNTDFDVPDCPDADFGSLEIDDVVGIVDRACTSETAQAVDLGTRLDRALHDEGLPLAQRLSSGRAAVATLRASNGMLGLPRPARADDRRLVDAVVADHFAGAARLASAIDALEAGDLATFADNREAGLADIADAVNGVVALGASGCQQFLAEQT